MRISANGIAKRIAMETMSARKISTRQPARMPLGPRKGVFGGGGDVGSRAVGNEGNTLGSFMARSFEMRFYFTGLSYGILQDSFAERNGRV